MTGKAEISYANSLFEQPWWLDIVAPGKWGEAVVRDENTDRVIARLPYVIDRGRISRPLYTQTMGIWMDEELRRPQRGNDQYSRQKAVIHQLLEQLPVKRGIDFVFDSSQSYILPFRWEGYMISPSFSYRIQLDSDMEGIEANFSKNIRRDINRGKKTLTVHETESIEEFIELQNHTFRRQNRKNPIENSFTYNVIERAMALDHGKIMIAKDTDGYAHAGAFVVYDKKVCFHLMSGQNTAYGNDGAIPMLFQQEIAFAADHSEAFDFEGSMIEGIEQVYRRYGGRIITNWHVSKQPMLTEIMQVMKPRMKRFIGYRI